MIGEAQTGTGFGGLARYLALGKQGVNPERVEWAEARNVPTTDPELYPAMMRATARLSRRVQDPVFHFSISWPVDERLERDQMTAIADRTLDDLGLADHQSVIVCHNDTEHPHLHVIANRVHPETGKAWAKWRYKTRLERSLKSQEREHGLQEVPGRLSKTRTPRRTEGADINTLAHLDKDEIKTLRQRMRPHLDGAASWRDLVDRAAEIGLSLWTKGQGIILSNGSSYAKLSELAGKKHRLAQLEQRFGAWKDFASQSASKRGFARNGGLSRAERDEVERRLTAFKRRRDRDRDDDDRER